MMSWHVDELRHLYRDRRLIPFVGAGASMSVQWTQAGAKRRGPSWGELVNRACDLLGFEDPALARVRGTDLQILEYFKLKNDGQIARLTNWLSAEMRPPEDALRASPIHAALARMTECRIFYTTNYDDFLERAFMLADRTASVIARESHMGTHADCEIVKFHGDLDHPDRMVLSESDYERRLSFQDPLDVKFQADLLGRAALFIGYSFRDPNVSYLFRQVNERLRKLPGTPTGRRAYIATQAPSDFEMALFRERNMEVIPLPGTDSAQSVANLLQEIAS